MSHIAIPIPSGFGKQDIEIEIKINGQRKQVQYRVELFYWEDCDIPQVNRVECVRSMLKDYEDDWLLYYIGEPNDDFIPITFVKKKEKSTSQEEKMPL